MDGTLPKTIGRARLGGPCRLCGLTLSHNFVDLGMSPLCQSVIRPDNADAMEPFFPLKVLVCERCFLVQLGEYVSASDIFEEYAYFSSFSTSWLAHAKSYCEMIAKRLSLGADSLVVELASNDGYLLQHFGPLGVPVLGVEPAANVAKVAVDKGIPTVVDFFTASLAQKLVSEGKKADLICGSNVLAQIPDLNDFVAGMPILLKPEGLVTIEFPHLERLMDESQFDTIYHEHFCYFSATTIDFMADRHGMKFIDVEELATHGGSLRVYLAHKNSSHKRSAAVVELLNREARLGLNTVKGYASFDEKVRTVKRDILAFLIEAKRAGKKIVGYGAPGKGNTMLNYCGIGPDFLDFTVDRNPYKQNTFTPGMRIPILSVEAIDAAKPDYVLILPWNLKNEIVAQMRHIGDWGGKFVVPIPQTRVIDPKEIA